jgi:hypothetical protein
VLLAISNERMEAPKVSPLVALMLRMLRRDAGASRSSLGRGALLKSLGGRNGHPGGGGGVPGLHPLGWAAFSALQVSLATWNAAGRKARHFSLQNPISSLKLTLNFQGCENKQTFEKWIDKWMKSVMVKVRRPQTQQKRPKEGCLDLGAKILRGGVG